MTKKTRFYVALTIASGAALVAACLTSEGALRHSGVYLAYVLLASLASTLKVRLPGITGTISVNFLFILIAVAVFTFAETVLLAAVAGLIQCLWRPKSRPRLLQVSFNVAALALSSGASYRISHLLAGPQGTHVAVLLAIAASFYFTADTLLVSGVLSLVQHKSLFDVWQQCYLWSFPYYLAGAAIAGLALSAYQTAGWGMSLLIVPPMVLVYAFYRLCIGRVERRRVVAMAGA